MLNFFHMERKIDSIYFSYNSNKQYEKTTSNYQFVTLFHYYTDL